MYLFYLDESGEREYKSRSQYFTICALGVPIEEWKAINNDMLVLKQTYFKNVEVEVKSNWLRNPKEREKRYVVPYSITEAELKEFTDKIYDMLMSYNIVVIASVVDKLKMQQKYAKPQSPSSVAYRLIFERVELFLKNQVDTHGILIFDKITELEMKKKGYENLLARQHLRYLEKGTEFLAISRIAEGLLFIPSHENNLLQLADLCAYNVHRQFRAHGKECDSPDGFVNRYSYFERIEPKLYKSADGNFMGWGLKRFP
ncbi:MAG: DUF3800 domain-containing protein [Armatimonadetes bacterium]|nr:DUF3800 domain-containing protein [Armatimonadota bacterium]